MRQLGKRLAGWGFAALVGLSPPAIAGDDPAPAASAPAPAGEKWITLFNGKDLEGWTPKLKGEPLGEDRLGTFRVEDGKIKVSYEKYKSFDDHFGHLFYKSPFAKYRLRIEYRFVGDQCPGGPGWATRNSGVMIHCQPPATMRVDQDFPVSIEVQFLGGGERGERPTGNLCTPGTNVVMGGKLVTQHCNNSTSPTLRGDRWVTAEVESHGHGTIKHLIDGAVVLTYEQPQLDPNDADGKALIMKADGEKRLDGGYIALQAESHPVEFRKVEILPLEE
jgi:hypothetical protein